MLLVGRASALSAQPSSGFATGSVCTAQLRQERFPLLLRGREEVL